MKRLFAALSLLAVAGCAGPVSAEPASTGGTASAIKAELAKVKVIPSRPEVPGYKRDQFGQTWTDDHSGRGGHNGCDTRNDVLKAQMTGVAVKPGTEGCVALSGTGTDPYTGAAINWRKSSGGVDIDHVYALARAWDMGAASWSPERRVDFANDQATNLLVSKSASNRSKGDDGPGEWLPLKPVYACAWVLRYLQVADKWGLPITAGDRDAAREILPTCGGVR